MKPQSRLAEQDRDAPSSVADLDAARADGQVILADPTPVELVWMEELRNHLRSPEVDVTSVHELSHLFDTYCLAWHAAIESDRWDPNYVITALGVALGDVLVAQSGGSRWMVTAGQSSTTVAVRNDLFRGTIFPVDAVARRWITAETRWMAPFIESMSVTLHRALTRSAIGRG
ncbi:protein of unknown function [Sanguibacter gelidistatuariae]|uniref:DUF3806 domain-containing protein n=1 Tax=Sanguibacter gelidistatuariae TaxID=1814289 RepID=A0A1G6HQP7_9MICO|nr:DUF3806 domain-containing protein [Sanguibacter gelidistatuariae]SDB96521.1 protein of unknown function [Sanguibacter gelidistatuariae]